MAGRGRVRQVSEYSTATVGGDAQAVTECSGASQAERVMLTDELRERSKVVLDLHAAHLDELPRDENLPRGGGG